MNRKMKLTLALFPVLFLCAVLAIYIFVFSGDYEYEIRGNAAIITIYKGMENVVTIPATLGGVPVKEIGSKAFSMNRYIRVVKIPDGVTKIGDSAFAQTYMTQVFIPDSMTEIGSQAFKNTWLSDFLLPENLERLGDEAFLKSPEALGDQAFWNSANKTAIKIPAKVSYIGEAFLSGSRKVKSIEVSLQNTAYVSLDGVLYSGDRKTLLSYPAGRSADRYDIPAGVKRIAAGAFRNSTITAVFIPEGVESIGNDAFGGCMELLKIDLPASVTSIEDDIHFAINCDALESINVSPDNPVYASMDGVLYDKAMTRLQAYPKSRKGSRFTVPPGVKFIGTHAFYGSKYITEVRLPDGVESIGEMAFALCQNLAQIVLPDSLTTLGSDAFNYCLSLRDIIIPPRVTSIGPGTFATCWGLSSIVIPPGVTSIGEDAFNSYCPTLVIFGEADSFAQTYARKIKIPFMTMLDMLPAGG